MEENKLEEAESIYFLQKVEIPKVDQDFEVSEVLFEDEVLSDKEEDWESTVRIIKKAEEHGKIDKHLELPASVEIKHEPIEDLIFNFLAQKGMVKTLDYFQTELYELSYKFYKKTQEESHAVPDVYLQNLNLEKMVTEMKSCIDKLNMNAVKAQNAFENLKREKDYHALRHRQIIQEKFKLLQLLTRFLEHSQMVDENIKVIVAHYEVALREKNLTKLDRDRIADQMTSLQRTIKNLQGVKDSDARRASSPKMKRKSDEFKGMDRYVKDFSKPMFIKKYPKDSMFPLDVNDNPLKSLRLSTKKGQFKKREILFHLSNTIRAHSQPISGISGNKEKVLYCTASDDKTWKLWNMTQTEPLLTGVGHSDWLSDCAIHPTGSYVLTSSGDTTLKLWETNKGTCKETFKEHSMAVWACSFHSWGDFFASCSMDTTIKLWDINSLRCRYTIYGHKDSVNSVKYLEYSNYICSGSTDKVVKIWDTRSTLCMQSYRAHKHSVNDVRFNEKGDLMASCDAFGTVIVWDIRVTKPMTKADVGPLSANQVTFDVNGSLVIIASSDSCLKVLDLAVNAVNSLPGHEDAVLGVYTLSQDAILSVGSDGTLRFWA